MYESGLCSCGCGYPADVSQAPENEGRFDMDAPIRCHARTAIVQGTKRYDDESTIAPEALLFDRPTLRLAANQRHGGNRQPAED